MVKEDAERLAQRLRLSNAEAERLVALELWWRVSPAAGEQAAHALLYQLGPQSFADRVLLAWSRVGAGAADRAWHALANLPQRWTAPVFPLKAADFHRIAALPQARLWARPCARPRKPGSRRIFRLIAPRSNAIADRAARDAVTTSS